MVAVDFEVLRRQLSFVGDALASAFNALQEHPSATRAQQLAIQCEGARLLALAVAEAVRAEVADAD